MSDQNVAIQKSSSPTLGRFAAKVAIVAAISGVTIIVIGNVMLGAVHDMAADVAGTFQQAGGPQFWAKIERDLDRAADPQRGLPPEKKAKIIAQIKAASAQWKPFIADIYHAVADTPPNAPTNK